MATAVILALCASQVAAVLPYEVDPRRQLGEARLFFTPLDGFVWWWSILPPTHPVPLFFSHGHVIVQVLPLPEEAGNPELPPHQSQVLYVTHEFAPVIPTRVQRVITLLMRDADERHETPDSFGRFLLSLPPVAHLLLNPMFWVDLCRAHLYNEGFVAHHDGYEWLPPHRHHRLYTFWEGPARAADGGNATFADINSFVDGWGLHYDFGHHNCHKFALHMFHNITGIDHSAKFLDGRYPTLPILLVFIAGFALVAALVMWPFYLAFDACLEWNSRRGRRRHHAHHHHSHHRGKAPAAAQAAHAPEVVVDGKKGQ